MAELGLLAPLEQQIRLVAFRPHIRQLTIEPGRVESVPEQRFPPRIKTDAATL
jgi:hypothetical protein